MGVVLKEFSHLLAVSFYGKVKSIGLDLFSITPFSYLSSHASDINVIWERGNSSVGKVDVAFSHFHQATSIDVVIGRGELDEEGDQLAEVLHLLVFSGAFLPFPFAILI